MPEPKPKPIWIYNASFVERTVLFATHKWRIIITPLILLCDERRFFAFFFVGEANWIFYSLSRALMQKDLNNDRMGNWAFTIQLKYVFFRLFAAAAVAAAPANALCVAAERR